MVYLVYMYEKDNDLNNNYFSSLDENFKEAIDLFERDVPHDEIFNLLQNGNIVQKQIAALKLDKLNNYQEAEILVKNLIGQDGKIREAVSLKINEFKNSAYLYQKNIYDIFLQAIIDINANICRNIIDTIDNMTQDSNFAEYFSSKLIFMTNELISQVEKFDFQEGKYKINKEVFKLYWCLETIYHIAEKIEINELKNILCRTKNINEYTIREKTAKILSKNFNDKDLITIRSELKNDKNYYVRRF